jgi:hypothetical protein
MFIKNWKDTAFGSDYGNDFKDFLEKINTEPITLTEIYQQCDLRKYLDQPDLLNLQTDNNVKLANPQFEQFVHYEDAVIALSAIVVESELNGAANLQEAYGSKTLTFKISKSELTTLSNALTHIYDNPDKFILFELCQNEERKQTLADIAEIMAGLKTCMQRK